MKYFNRILLLALVLSLSACAYQPTPVMLPSIGPAPEAETGPESAGYLLVYSDWSRDPTINRHSRYTILGTDGRPSREIANHRDMYDTGPTRIALAPGTYHISARCAHTGRVLVPVEIRKGATTYVYLDGSSHPDIVASDHSALVKLPDGRIAGWAATK